MTISSWWPPSIAISTRFWMRNKMVTTIPETLKKHILLLSVYLTHKMCLHLYNLKSRNKERFIPGSPQLYSKHLPLHQKAKLFLENQYLT
jgi:hypothetical protein